MGRPRKQTVDYFPHYCDHRKTMFVIEQRYGNDGYAFWFKLLELLGKAEGHCLQFATASDWNYLCARTRLDPDKCEEIMGVLAEEEAIDKEMWSKYRAVWSENFVDGVGEAYRKRRSEVPVRPTEFPRLSGGRNGITSAGNGVSSAANPSGTLVSSAGNPHTIRYETKGKDPPPPSVRQKPLSDAEAIIGFEEFVKAYPQCKWLRNKGMMEQARKNWIRARRRDYSGEKAALMIAAAAQYDRELTERPREDDLIIRPQNFVGQHEAYKQHLPPEQGEEPADPWAAEEARVQATRAALDAQYAEGAA